MTENNRKLTKWLTAIPITFILGAVTFGATWKTNVDRTNTAQTDSIYVNAVKYECLVEGYTALQYSDRVLTERVTILEARVDEIYKQNMAIQEAIFFELTGEEWEQE